MNQIRKIWKVKIHWLSLDEGGRKTIPPKGRFFSVARFDDYVDNIHNEWSVVFDLDHPIFEGGAAVSLGTVGFLVKNSPQEKMDNCTRFFIYEGRKKVARVDLPR